MRSEAISSGSGPRPPAREVELDLDAVRIVEKQLGTAPCPFARRWLKGSSPFSDAPASSAGRLREGDVIGERGARAASARCGRVFLLDPLPLSRSARCARVSVSPSTSSAPGRPNPVRAGRHAEDSRVPVARRVDIVRGDQEVLDVRNSMHYI